jgi:hypothetical protein
VQRAVSIFGRAVRFKITFACGPGWSTGFCEHRIIGGRVAGEVGEAEQSAKGAPRPYASIDAD